MATRLTLAGEAGLAARLPFTGHGAVRLPGVEVESYNLELREAGRFVGDRASKSAFFAHLDAWRATSRKRGEDPFGNIPSEAIGKRALDKVLKSGDPIAAGVVQAAIDDFARALVETIAIFRKKAWRRIERIVVGGGFRGGRVGELAIGRAQMLLHEANLAIELVPIRQHPDAAGLVGAAHLVPSWILAGFDAILAADIGGTNLRCGIVSVARKRSAGFAEADVERLLHWRHDDDAPKREDFVAELAAMLQKLIRAAARSKLRLAPFVGVGCPGRIRLDGRIERGAQNLPGNWQAARFHLPTRLREAVPQIGGHGTVVLMHNDAVVQGLSELPFMQDVARWSALTIGTGLGNAAFANQVDPPPN